MEELGNGQRDIVWLFHTLKFAASDRVSRH